ncbi:DUF4255 domain-containing protein [Natronolimnobius sp. AArcel1]|uniref:Pvc16 family protein n=1 Tax=Natronolimnobius sp. AArcel1 TaxID=1679093 RepID=UPI0013EADE64|nr:Pvc16 family protein [Natronolimnobius sp. AArcel1]NGM70799.1 DUF4255 domain-containing protein [Natronolimnobius sp. AArcel1]
MSYSAIADVSNALLEVMATNVAEHSPLDPNRIAVASPAELGSLSDIDLVLCPYRIETDNSRGTVSRTTTETTRQDPPLSLSIRYLVVPRAGENENDDAETQMSSIERQRLLGAALQIFHDTSRLEPDEVPVPLIQDEPLTISITDEPFDDVLSLWSQYPDIDWRLAATIEVRPAMIQSLNEETFTRVEDREAVLRSKPEQAPAESDEATPVDR